jgi:hypothetical protein
MEIIIKSEDITLESIEEFTDQMSEYFSTDFVAYVEVKDGMMITHMKDN